MKIPWVCFEESGPWGFSFILKGILTLKVRRRIGGMNSGMPNAPARLSWVVAHVGLFAK